MTESEPDPWQDVLEATHAAVRAFARVEFASLARKVIYRLQRMDASGIFGDDYGHRTLWDEYCHEVQEGPHEALDGAWDHTLAGFYADVIDRVPHHTAVLLSAYAAWDDGAIDEAEIVGTVWIDGIQDLLERALKEAAMDRRLNTKDTWC